MKNVPAMESIREWIVRIMRDGSWRLALLLLPWQIRWFSEGSFVNEYPWEQGRISIYVSWILMLVTIGAALYKNPPQSPLRKEGGTASSHSPPCQGGVGGGLWLIGLILLLLVSLFTLSFRSTFQWWLEWLVLFGFFWSLSVLRVPVRSVISWFLLSLVPHILLGIWQYLIQYVHGTKWLGMAMQNPLDRGVSVIEIADRRVLRAYGGFPHPNIFGGWIVMGMMGACWMWDFVKKYQRWLLGGFLALASVALVLTFSRSAWLAVVFGLGGLFVHWFFRAKKLEFVIPVLLIFLTIALTAFSQRSLVFTRLEPFEARLETKSVDERQEAIKNGWQLFKQHPWIGTGPGTTVFALSRLSSVDPTVPPVPPHLVPLMMLDELGVLGVFGLILLMVFLYKVVIPSGPCLQFILPLLPLLFLDHYLWSVWNGKGLFAVAILILISKKKDALNP